MKKLFTILLALVLSSSMLIVGCGKDKTKETESTREFSKEAYGAGYETVNILKHYLDMDIDASTAVSKLYAIDTSFEGDMDIYSSIIHAISVMSDIAGKWGKYSDVDARNTMNELKELLNIE